MSRFQRQRHCGKRMGDGWTITLNEDKNGNGSLDGFEDTDLDGVLDTGEDAK